MTTNPDGQIRRADENTVIVEVEGETWAKDAPGVECMNPEEPEATRVYRKTFRVKPIYLPGEYDRAIASHVAHEDNFVVSMNGYSRITDEQCRRYGIKPGEYEEACSAIMREAINHLRTKFRGAHLRLIYGASDLGVDAAIESVAHEFNITPLGFSCPRFMLYVKDDSIPVYVGRDKEEYADRFIETLDLLIATGGREQAFVHDISAILKFRKRIHFVDVLNTLSTTGGVPATIVDKDGRVTIDNAAAAFGYHISFFGLNEAFMNAPEGGDKWDAVLSNIRSISTQECRRKMSATRKFR